MTGRTAPAARVRVALFLIATLAVLVGALIVLGHSTNLFSRKATLHTSFANVGGLIAGSEVRLAGVAVGVVRNIHFLRDPGNPRVSVDLSVRGNYLDRIRKDSVAQVTSKGLLGDAIVEISVGSPDKPALADGDAIDSEEPAGIGQIIARVESALQRIDALAGDMDVRVRQFLTPEVAADFGRLIHSSAAVAEGVRLALTPQVEADFAQLVHSATAVASGVEHGPGLAHALIFQPAIAADAAHAIHELDRGGSELQQLFVDVRTGRGLLHELVYDQDSPKLIQDLGDTARIVRQIAVDTQQGKGTIGGLLEDPTIYEDLTTILGNIKRNSLLKALIRYTIVKDGLERNGRVEGKDVPATPVDAAGK